MAADSAALAAELRRRLGPAPQLPEWPLVSIVVLNRDGAAMLRRLLAGLVEHTDYPRFELILVDNASSDESLDFIRRVEAPFPISIIANPHNESFSDACNQGAELANGELLLFLNNDVEPFEDGWLRELVACLARTGSSAGAVSSTLACPDHEHEASFEYGYGVQHRGLGFREEEGMLVPELLGWEEDPLDEWLGEDEERPAVAAACLLVSREAFERVGGFTHGYVYGAEDIDLCLKLRTEGLEVLCSGRSLAIHHPVSTRRAAPFEEQLARKLANRRVLWERWGPRLRREYELERLAGGGSRAEERRATAGRLDRPVSPLPTRVAVEEIGYCLITAEPAAESEFEAVAAALRRRRRCLLLAGGCDEDPIALNYDVAVYLRGSSRYVQKPAQLNVLWIEVDRSRSVTVGECSHYDLVASTSAEVLDRLAKEGLSRSACVALVGDDARALALALQVAVEARVRHAGFPTRICPVPVSAYPVEVEP